MPLWLNFVMIPAWNVRTRKTILASLFILYSLLPIYLLIHLKPNNFGDMYAPYMFSCVYFIHWAFVAYTVYYLWLRQK